MRQKVKINYQISNSSNINSRAKAPKNRKYSKSKPPMISTLSQHDRNAKANLKGKKKGKMKIDSDSESDKYED